MWRSPELLLGVMMMATPATTSPLKFLALGDSYTIGEAVPEVGRWPVQLAAMLRAHEVAIDPPQIIATTGWTTDELSAAMDAAELAPSYDFVTLLIGVNDQYRGHLLAQYRVQFASLLARAIHLARGRADRVMVLSIPDWGVTPFAISSGRDRAQIAAELDQFNAAAQSICIGQGAVFVDITALSRNPGAQAQMLAADGLHPSAAQYTLWARQALAPALGLLAD